MNLEEEYGDFKSVPLSPPPPPSQPVSSSVASKETLLVSPLEIPSNSTLSSMFTHSQDKFGTKSDSKCLLDEINVETKSIQDQLSGLELSSKSAIPSTSSEPTSYSLHSSTSKSLPSQPVRKNSSILISANL
jgi:hypothetical protein